MVANPILADKLCALRAHGLLLVLVQKLRADCATPGDGYNANSEENLIRCVR